jgi:hypothetical protein
VQNPKHRARRWVVEVNHSWLNRFRKLLVRFEKTHRSYLALLMPGCAIIAFRKAEGPGKINIFTDKFLASCLNSGQKGFPHNLIYDESGS